MTRQQWTPTNGSAIKKRRAADTTMLIVEINCSGARYRRSKLIQEAPLIIMMVQSRQAPENQSVQRFRTNHSRHPTTSFQPDAPSTNNNQTENNAAFARRWAAINLLLLLLGPPGSSSRRTAGHVRQLCWWYYELLLLWTGSSDIFLVP